MTQRTLTDAEITAYRQDGVVLVKRAIDPDLVPRMIAAVDAHLARTPTDGSPRTSTGMNRHLYPTDPEFRSFAFDTGLARLAAQATGSETIRIYFDQLFVKDAHTDEAVFHWHQDHPFWPIEGTQICSTWVALTHADVEASALEFVRGSHRSGITYRPYFGGPTDIEQLNRMWPNFGAYVASFPHEIERFEDHPLRYDVIGFEVEPGDALLFDYRIVHRSRGNRSPNRRVAVSWRWLGDDAVWNPVPGADPVIGPEHTTLRPGDRITDDVAFPVVHSGVAALTSALTGR